VTIQQAFELALGHHKAGRLAKAEPFYRQILGTQPDHAEALHMLGLLAHQSGHHDVALGLIGRAVVLVPNDAGCFANLCDVHRVLGRFDEAVAAGNRAIALRPGFAIAHNNLANALMDMGRFDEAIAACRRTLELIPDDPEAKWNHSLLLLLGGDFQRGWPLYEARWDTDRLRASKRDFRQPMWDGSPLNGQRVLLHSEQGFGDSIQFIRYAPLVAKSGGVVVVECQPSLAGLFATVEGVSKVVGDGEPLPPFDLHVPMLSLPFVFKTEPETIPSKVPYLAIDPARGQFWRDWLGDDGSRLKVGLVWAGRTSNFQQGMRAIQLRQLLPLLDVSGVNFVSLQMDGRAGQIFDTPGASNIRDPREHIGDFADTAALIAQLDLVITIDTAVAHLAGALGVPLWVMLPFAPDWRWFLHREDSPWYPTARLFRQQRILEWDPVIAKVRAELQSLVQSRE
jgi:hypothetical protein